MRNVLVGFSILAVLTLGVAAASKPSPKTLKGWEGKGGAVTMNFSPGPLSDGAVTFTGSAAAPYAGVVPVVTTPPYSVMGVVSGDTLAIPCECDVGNGPCFAVFTYSPASQDYRGSDMMCAGGSSATRVIAYDENASKYIEGFVQQGGTIRMIGTGGATQP